MSSSLLQVPLAHAMLNRGKKVGVLTASARSLTDRHLAGVGIRDIPLVVMGMEDAEEFTGTFIDGKPSLDPEKVRQEMVGVAQKMAASHPEIGAVVLECTNMPPYSKAVQDVVKLPVFDIVTLIKYTYSSAVSQEYRG